MRPSVSSVLRGLRDARLFMTPPGKIQAERLFEPEAFAIRLASRRLSDSRFDRADEAGNADVRSSVFSVPQEC